jgi:hypothetical protein
MISGTQNVLVPHTKMFLLINSLLLGTLFLLVFPVIINRFSISSTFKSQRRRGRSYFKDPNNGSKLKKFFAIA